MGGVRTIEQAMALPEVASGMYIELRETGADGITTSRYVPRKFCPRPIDGEEIAMFVDSDGRSKTIVYTEDGPAKAPFYF